MHRVDIYNLNNQSEGQNMLEFNYSLFVISIVFAIEVANCR